MYVQYAAQKRCILIYSSSGYRPSLCRRLARLETMLGVPTGKRWKIEATLSDCNHTYVEGIRLDEAVLDKFGHQKSAATSSQHTQPSTVSIPFAG